MKAPITKIFATTAALAFAAGFAATNAVADPGHRQHKPFTVSKGAEAAEHGHARVRGGLNPADTVQAPQKEQRMLLPTVQKVRHNHAQQAEKGHARVRGGLNPANTVQAPQKEQRTEKGHARVRGGLNPANTVQAPKKDEKGLLLPAVQKAH